MSAKSFISDMLVVNADFLKSVKISNLSRPDFDELKPSIIPCFCYDNSYLTAVRLDLDCIVYGAAIVDFGGSKIPIEHAWVKSLDGSYHDPTYQVLDERNGFGFEVEYYSLIEFPIKDYVELVGEVHGQWLSSICAVDFTSLRQFEKFRKYFNRK